MWHTSLLALQGVYQLYATNKRHEHTILSSFKKITQILSAFFTTTGSAILCSFGALEIFTVRQVALVFTQFGQLLYFIAILLIRPYEGR